MLQKPKLVRLDTWAERCYGDDAPPMKTLYRWIRDAKIQPRPQKHGRSYFVMETARYVSHGDFDGIAEAHRESQTQ